MSDDGLTPPSQIEMFKAIAQVEAEALNMAVEQELVPDPRRMRQELSALMRRVSEIELCLKRPLMRLRQQRLRRLQHKPQPMKPSTPKPRSKRPKPEPKPPKN
jgi:hypothetical protein